MSVSMFRRDPQPPEPKLQIAPEAQPDRRPPTLGEILIGMAFGAFLASLGFGLGAALAVW